MLIKINSIPGYDVGDVIRVKDDGKDPPQPKSMFWRRRLKDARSDKCCEIVHGKNKEDTGLIVKEDKE